MRNKLIYGLIGCFTIGVLISSCKNNSQIEEARYYINGKTTYKTHCQKCHGKKSEGLGLFVPPLIDTNCIENNKIKLSAIIKYGMEGPLTIIGRLYAEKMTAATHLTPIEITYIIYY